MTARTRSRINRRGQTGTIHLRSRETWTAEAPYGDWWQLNNSREYIPHYEFCQDSTNAPPYPDTDLYIEKCDIQPGYFVGISTGPLPSATQVRGSRYVINPCDYRDAETGHLPPLAWTGPADYINPALAKMNPNRAELDLANFLWELREIPQLLAGAGVYVGNRGPTGIGSKPIEYTFGWAPLISDLSKLLRLTDIIDGRLAELNRLRKKERREQYMLDRKSHSWTSFLRDEGAINYRYKRETTLEVWCVKKHKIVESPLRPPKPFTRKDAFKAAFTEDLTLTIWNSLPWSWLIDYFFGIADFLSATGNRVPGYTVTSLCIMHKLTTKMSHESLGKWPGWHGSSKIVPMKGTRTSKRRLAITDPSVTLPALKIISAGQLFTLSQLFVAKATSPGSMRITR